MTLLTKEEIEDRLMAFPYIDIFEQNEKMTVVYDHITDIVITYNYPERYTPQDLQNRIHILSPMPSNAQINIENLVHYLWENMDHNAFITLDALWFVNDPDDYQKIAEYYNDDGIYEVVQQKSRGFFWFSHQACVVDVSLIIDRLNKQRDTTKTFTQELRKMIMEVAIHEMRHQMLDATLILSKEHYPREWGSEFHVRRYAGELCDETNFDEVFQ